MAKIANNRAVWHSLLDPYAAAVPWDLDAAELLLAAAADQLGTRARPIGIDKTAYTPAVAIGSDPFTINPDWPDREKWETVAHNFAFSGLDALIRAVESLQTVSAWWPTLGPGQSAFPESAYGAAFRVRLWTAFWRGRVPARDIGLAARLALFEPRRLELMGPRWSGAPTVLKIRRGPAHVGF